MTLVSRITMLYWVFLAVLFAHTCNGFLMPERYMHKYVNGDSISVKVNSLTSVDSLLPLSYYSLPYCKPTEGIRKSDLNFGELLIGDQILNSPYRFKMNVNELIFLCITNPLTKQEAEVLQQRIRDLYQVTMILDNMPLMRYSHSGELRFRWNGFPVGYEIYNTTYFINHLKFRVLINELEPRSGEGPGVIIETDDASKFVIVGFEVTPYSIKSKPSFMAKMYDRVASVAYMVDTDEPQIIREGERITFSYEVEFVKSNTKWSSRWDAYLKTEDTEVHWFPILYSLICIFILAGSMFFRILMTIRKDLKSYSTLDSEGQMNNELPEWKLIEGDVFREPYNFKLLCVMVGSGVQITGAAVYTVIFAALDFFEPARRGMLLTGMILLYLFMAIAAGFVAVRLWRFIKGTSEEWSSVSLLVAGFFPSIICVIITIMNFVHLQSNSTAYIPFNLYAVLLSLWFCISLPLTLLGGFLASKPDEQQYYMSVNKIPREIPKYKFSILLKPLILIGGFFPFSTIFMEYFFILSSLWLGRYYNTFGFLLMSMLMLFIVCAQVSMLYTFSGLRIGNWQWWWKSFSATGVTAVYLFAYAVNYLVYNLQSLNGPESVVLYLGYSLIMTIAFMLSTGTIGFLVSLFFVRYLYKPEQF